MFGQNTINTGLSFSKVLSGLSKALGVANQAIPLYKEIKPMVSNARKVLSVVKEFNKTNTIKVTNKENKKVIPDKGITPSTSNPVFFQ